MDIEEIKTLTDLMVEHDLSEIMIRDGEKRIVLRRGSQGPAQILTVPAAPPALAAVPAAPPVERQSASTDEAKAGEEDPNLARITSPMVGTFYSAPDPDSPPYVKIGDKVTADSVVCIIEAMKVFNEIKAETAGTIESIDIQTGQPVEFGQVIMTVRGG